MADLPILQQQRELLRRQQAARRSADEPLLGETREQMLAQTGGGVLETIPKTYGAVSEETKDLRAKEAGMKRTQERLLGPSPEMPVSAAEAPPEPEGARERPKAERERAVMQRLAYAARREAEAEEEKERIAAAGAQAAQQPQRPPHEAASAKIRSMRLGWLFTFFGIPLYGLTGFLQLLHKIIGSPFGKWFDTKWWEDLLAGFIVAIIALIFYFLISIILSLFS